MARRKVDATDPNAWIKKQLKPRSRRGKKAEPKKGPPVDYGQRVRMVAGERVVVWPRPRA